MIGIRDIKRKDFYSIECDNVIHGSGVFSLLPPPPTASLEYAAGR